MGSVKERTIHFFVSSTFRDLNDERNYLVNVTFPDLIRKARERGVYVTYVDLRWGITEESLSKIINICLDEIDRARPYFIGILGNIYGSVPEVWGEIRELANVPDNLKKKWIQEGYSLTHIEMDYGVLTKPETADYSYFYFKSEKVTDNNFNQKDSEKLKNLKKEIKIPNSKWHWNKDEFRSPEELGEQVKNDFMKMLDTVYPLESAPSPLEILRSLHSEYSSFLLRNYVEDREKVNEILSSLEEEGKVLVTGEVGIGKSSMLAFVKREYEKKNPNALIIEHYIGAGGNETSKDIALHILAEVKDMLRKLNIPFTEEKLESDENKIYDAISKLISYIPDWKKSLIVIDGIDQLSDLRETIFLNFLPKIKILVSCRDGTNAMEHMKSFSYKTIVLSQLDMEKIKEIIKSVLKEMGKELTEDQINRISSSKASSNPLYLRTLIDQLCKIGELKKNTETQTDFMNRMIEKHLKPNLEDLYGLMIENLKDILKKYFDDEDVVIQFLKLIAVSRSGLSQQEIVSMSNIKPAEFAVIRNYLDYHLAEKNGLIDFFHASLKEVVFKKYINNNVEKETRRIISNWFLGQKTDKRQIYELPYQLFALGDKSILKEYVKKFEVFKLFTEVLNSTEYFEFIMYLKSSFGNLCKEVVEAYQPQILSLSEDESSLYFNSLGLVCLNTGCYNEAMDSFNKSLQINRKYYGDEHPDVASDLNNLGNLYGIQGRYDDAEKMYNQALEIDR
ncbi:MAG: tetratricopeptide repeat protein, partial [Thermoplasmatales archaeon]